MKLFKTYWYQSALFTILQRFSLVFFGLVSYLLLVRNLSESKMGVWALFLAISTTFEMSKYALLKNGFITLFHSTASRKDQGSIASSSLVLNVLFTIAFIILIFTGSHWIGQYWKVGELQSMLRWYVVASILLIPFSHWEYIQQANMTFKGIFAAYFARQGCFFLLVIIATFWFSGYVTLNLLVIFQIIGLAFGTFIAWIYSRKFINKMFAPSKFWIGRLFRYGKYVLGSGVCANIFGSLDRYMTASFMTSSSVAFYDVSARINNLMDVPTTAAADILFPKSARASVEDGNSRVKYIYEKMVGILVGLVLPISIFIFVFADKIILIIAGDKYLPATGIIKIAMVYAFLRPVQIQASNVLNSINKPQLTFYLNLVVLSFNMTVSYCFIKSFGFMGAAYGAFLTTVFSSILSFCLLKRAIDVSVRGIVGEMWNFYEQAIRHCITFWNQLRSLSTGTE